jgi:hypothetical protein
MIVSDYNFSPDLQLVPWNRIIQLVKNFPARPFWNQKIYNRVHNTPRLALVLS